MGQQAMFGIHPVLVPQIPGSKGFAVFAVPLNLSEALFSATKATVPIGGLTGVRGMTHTRHALKK